jgi:hypothetical protein
MSVEHDGIIGASQMVVPQYLHGYFNILRPTGYVMHQQV